MWHRSASIRVLSTLARTSARVCSTAPSSSSSSAVASTTTGRPVKFLTIEDEAAAAQDAATSGKLSFWDKTRVYFGRSRRMRQFQSENPAYYSEIAAAAARLVQSCTNGIAYDELIEAFGLNDEFGSWYTLSMLHIWMVMLRVHAEMPALAYEKLTRDMLTIFVNDFDARLKVLETEHHMKMRKTERSAMNMLYYSMFMELDEGILSDDTVLAGALWRTVYSTQTPDPVNLLRAVRYVRSTIAYLDGIPTEQLLQVGVDRWHQASPSRKSEQQQQQQQEQMEEKSASSSAS